MLKNYCPNFYYILFVFLLQKCFHWMLCPVAWIVSTIIFIPNSCQNRLITRIEFQFFFVNSDRVKSGNSFYESSNIDEVWKMKLTKWLQMAWTVGPWLMVLFPMFAWFAVLCWALIRCHFCYSLPRATASQMVLCACVCLFVRDSIYFHQLKHNN